MKYSRWLLVTIITLLLIFSTACSCTDRIAGLFGRYKGTPTPTIEPTVEVMPLVIPKEAYQTFEGEMSAAELEKLVQEQLKAEAGDYVESISLRITPEAMLAAVQVNASQLNIKFGVTIAGAPNVVNGKVYLKVTQVTLDDTLSGWNRLSAKSMIQEMLDKYAGENGIPIEFDKLFIQEVQLREGRIYIKGQTLP